MPSSQQASPQQLRTSVISAFQLAPCQGNDTQGLTPYGVEQVQTIVQAIRSYVAPKVRFVAICPSPLPHRRKYTDTILAVAAELTIPIWMCSKPVASQQFKDSVLPACATLGATAVIEVLSPARLNRELEQARGAAVEGQDRSLGGMVCYTRVTFWGSDIITTHPVKELA